MLNITLHMSQCFCGWVQPFRTSLTLVSASAVCQLPHREALWVTHSSSTQVPLTVSGFPRSLWCPPHHALSKRVECVVPTLTQTILCITSVSGGVRASSTLVSRQSIACNSLPCVFQWISHLPWTFRRQNYIFCRVYLYFAKIQLTKCVRTVTHWRCAVLYRRVMHHPPVFQRSP